MPLGREVGLSPSDSVLDATQLPLPQKAAETRHFRPMSLLASTDGWIKMPLGTEVGLGPGHIVLDGDPAPPPPRKGHSSPPSFSPRLLWPRSPNSVTAELLY